MHFKTFIKNLNSSKCLFTVLVDPDKFNAELIKLADKNKVSCFLVGGSVLKKHNVSQIVKAIKKISDIPVILFPGDETQLSKNADGLLLPSVLSGRNAEYLIGKQVLMAPKIKKMKLQHLPIAYLLVEGGRASATQKITKTKPMNPGNISTIKNTSIAGEQLGFKAIYLEAGSGAKNNVSEKIVKQIRQSVSIPVIVGGGVDSKEKAKKLIKAGANMIVVGNALEKNINLINEISKAFNN